MSVHAIGVDAAEIDRIEEMITKHGDRFLQRVFTPVEIDYCQKKANAQSFAARFAVKEAVFKAAGTGLSMGMQWKDVEVENDERGKPFVRLYGETAEMLKNTNVHVSISHTGNMAIAMVVVEEKPPLIASDAADVG